MDQTKVKKIKPCVVKLNRMHIMEDIETIRERILDQRVRRCHVLLRRLNMNAVIPGVTTSTPVRRCCVRLPRLNTEVFEILERSSPAVLSGDNDDEVCAEEL